MDVQSQPSGSSPEDVEIVLRPPPVLPDPPIGGGVLTTVVPMLGSLGSVALMATMGSPAAHPTRGLVAAGLFLVTSAAFVVLQLDRQRQTRLQAGDDLRTAYHRYLDDVRRTVRVSGQSQRARLLARHPDPAVLPAMAAEGSHIWEGDGEDGTLQVRYGVGARPLSVRLVLPEATPGARTDPTTSAALRRLVAVHTLQPSLPATVDLAATGHLAVRGRPDQVRSLARAMTCSAAAFHSPELLAVAVVAPGDVLSEWDWVKWLPHALSPCAPPDAVGPRRMVGSHLTELTALLPPATAGPPGAHVLVVVDRLTGGGPVPASRPGQTLLELTADDATSSRLVFDIGPGPPGRRPRLDVREQGHARAIAAGDQCDVPTAEALARRLSARVPATAHRQGAAGLLHLLGLEDEVEADPEHAWRVLSPDGRLRTPIGTGGGGEVVHLDLEESARGGIGPHGVVIGATGSGKSELLRTLVLGLSLSHPPERLNVVLIDFKGGATFAGLSAMPHVSAVITNLAAELDLVDRMDDALSGELLRRQELLRVAGNLASVHDYERARASGAPLAPLPTLLVVVDEFSELLAARPALLELFAAIGRLGRSLGVHLLLASQRLEEGRLRGLEAHLSYRIALRTFSAQESHVVLGVPAAFHLPRRPGAALLAGDGPELRQFQTAYVSGPAPARHAVVERDRRDVPWRIRPWTVAEVPGDTPEPLPAAATTVLDDAVSRMAGHAHRAHQVWLPPLDVPDTLDRLMPDLAADPRLGLVSRHWRGRGRLTVPLGLVDRPRDQRREVLVAELTGSTGHVGIAGGPRSGKSTLLRTLVASLALTSTPVESQVYVLDFGGGTFGPLGALPHVVGIGTRSEPDVVRRIAAAVTAFVDRRETYFREARIDSVDTYRTRRAQGLADDGHGDVFLVVDGWSALRTEFDELEHQLQSLTTRGLAYGFHLLAATGRWSDLRPPLRDQLGTRVELRLGDPADSEVDRRKAASVPCGRPGRGLTTDGLHVLTALPRIDSTPDPATLADAVTRLATKVADAWPGPIPAKLRPLPELVPAGSLLADRPATAGDRRLLIGIAEDDLDPVALDPETEPHWLVLGDRRSGRTAALRAYIREVVRTRTPKQAQLVVVDYRRSLLGEVPEEYLVDHLTSAADAAPALASLAAHLVETRLPGPGAMSERVSRGRWWSGADLFVVVDDDDLVSTTAGSPLQALLPLLAQAHDVGLHLAVARRSGGAARAFYAPVLQALRELDPPSLLLSGSPEEGPLIAGLRPCAAPPGRGRLVTRARGVEVVQLAWHPPSP